MAVHDLEKARLRKLHLKKEVAKRKSQLSFYDYVKQAWKIVEPSRPFVDGWHIGAICEALQACAEGEIRNLIINIPPRHMKSMSVSVFFPTWVWGPHGRPSDDFLVASYNPKLVTRDAVKARNILQSQWYIDRWKDVFITNMKTEESFQRNGSILSAAQNQKMRYQNIHSGTRISTSPGGSGVGEGGDYIIVDDPHKVRGIDSKVQREGVIDWYMNELASRMNDPETAIRILMMQRLHSRDVCGAVLEEQGDLWEHLCLPFEYEPKVYMEISARNKVLKTKDPRTEPGELLWPERFSKKGAENFKRPMTAYQKSGQLQQRPQPKEGTIYKRKWFERRWETLPERFDYFIDGWDMTFGAEEGVIDDKAKGAFDVGYKVGVLGGQVYVLEETRRRLSPTQQESEVQKLATTNGQKGEIIIEDAANGRATARRLKKKITGVRLVRPVGSKEDRAANATYLFEAGNVLFPSNTKRQWAEDAVEEFIGFGPKATFKDRVDAMVHILTRIEERMGRNIDFDLPIDEFVKESFIAGL